LDIRYLEKAIANVDLAQAIATYLLCGYTIQSQPKFFQTSLNLNISGAVLTSALKEVSLRVDAAVKASEYMA